MTTVAEALEGIYESLANDNAEIDERIKVLKAALADEGLKEAVFEPARLAQNNRQGRKIMESYFKKRGVTVKFAKD
ncbi:hypothetical protein ABI_22810 [Asticcacaulis biprosthecium C19]|uniref:Uncharacterized protein n=1 Tax=Asticcacaulis biprosthecium C19 TaxID=715226 RepID=F4QNG1_9CAUL|nr:hypothetical protein [Asticcacaulis biprosthecium]EGF90869.1 hypothetical protein ABI_22810 [Asticcacaulis biprosthecium C19]